MDIPIFSQGIINQKIIHESFFSEEAAQWFRSAPKFSSVRVNTLKTSAAALVESIINSLLKENDTDTLVYVHNELKDCIIVGNKAVKFSKPEDGLAEVMVDSLCAAAVMRGADIFAPGVLSMLPYIKCNTRVNVFCDILGKCKKGFAKTFDGPKLYIGQGTLLMCRDNLFSQNICPSGVAVKMIDTISGVPQFFLDSTFGILQNLPSMLCSYALDVNENSVVLDMCAAPGNKTTHIATLMKNKGTIYAVDKIPRKVAAIEAKCKELDIKNVQCFVADSRYILEGGCNQGNSYFPVFSKESFDRILLDAPCSALGQRPLLVCKTSLNQILSFPSLQKQLFCTGYELLMPGGILVYSTCTITTDENEGLVSWALQKFPLLRLCKSDYHYGNPGLTCGNTLSDEELNLVQRFGPPCSDLPESDTIGFFIAKFIKLKNEETS